jgi:hypothetical protein
LILGVGGAALPSRTSAGCVGRLRRSPAIRIGALKFDQLQGPGLPESRGGAAAAGFCPDDSDSAARGTAGPAVLPAAARGTITDRRRRLCQTSLPPYPHHHPTLAALALHTAPIRGTPTRAKGRGWVTDGLRRGGPAGRQRAGGLAMVSAHACPAGNDPLPVLSRRLCCSPVGRTTGR